jgi:voltage-dependent calcium channel T type alpha-1G
MSLHHYHRHQQYHLDQQVVGSDPVHGSESDVAALSELEDDDEEDDDEDDEEDDDEEDEEDEEELPYPGFIPIALKYLDQNTRPRNWCLRMITNPYPFISQILFLGFYASRLWSAHSVSET